MIVILVNQMNNFNFEKNVLSSEIYKPKIPFFKFVLKSSVASPDKNIYYTFSKLNKESFGCSKIVGKLIITSIIRGKEGFS